MVAGVKVYDVVLDPSCGQATRGRAGDRRGETEHPNDCGAEHGLRLHAAPHDRVGRRSSLTVGRTGQRNDTGCTGHKVLDLDGIADGPDVRVARLLRGRHHDGALRGEVEAGLACERSGWAYADPEKHDVSGEPSAVREHDVDRMTIGAVLDRREADADVHINAMRAKLVLDKGGHLGVDRRKHLRRELDQGHLEAAMDERLDGLEADESRADDDGLTSTIGKHPHEDIGIGHGAQRAHLGPVEARERRHDRLGAGREDERVVRLRELLPGHEIAHLNGLRGAVDPEHLVTGAHIEIECGLERGRRVQEELVALHDLPAHVVGQAAVGERDVGALLEHHDARGLVEPAQSRRRRHTACDATHDNDSLHDCSSTVDTCPPRLRLHNDYTPRGIPMQSQVSVVAVLTPATA